MKVKLLLLFFLLSFTIKTTAQKEIKGIVSDGEVQSPLSYVNIGIKNKNIGTSSAQDGTFTLIIPSQHISDTLTFSIVGYTEYSIPIKSINQSSFYLSPKRTELSTVTVRAKALVEKKFGIKNEKALIHFTDGSTNQNDIFEITQLIRLDTTFSKVTSVNLLINQARKDSATFRINFYRSDSESPGERIIEKSIVQTKEIS